MNTAALLRRVKTNTRGEIVMPDKIQGFDIHPVADEFPPMTKERFGELLESIAKGYDETQPVVIWDAAILDGRNRAYACELLGIEAPTVMWDGERGTPEAYALSVNLHRRDLHGNTRKKLALRYHEEAKVAAKERQAAAGRASAKRRAKKKSSRLPSRDGKRSSGSNKKTKKHTKTAAAEAGAKAGLSGSSVERKARLAKHPDLLAAVEAGKMTQTAALAKITERNKAKKTNKKPAPAKPTGKPAAATTGSKLPVAIQKRLTKAHVPAAIVAALDLGMPDETRKNLALTIAREFDRLIGEGYIGDTSYE